MVGLLRLSSPTVLVNWNSETPRWLLLKGLETNLRTKGGIPLFENSDHVVSCFVNDGIPWKTPGFGTARVALPRSCPRTSTITALRAKER